jgi:hypothetical protein
MLIKKADTRKLKLTIHVTTPVAKRLDEIRRLAEADGYALDIENAVSAFLEREIGKAEKEFAKTAPASD